MWVWWVGGGGKGGGRVAYHEVGLELGPCNGDKSRERGGGGDGCG